MLLRRAGIRFATTMVLLVSGCASPVNGGHGDGSVDARIDAHANGDGSRVDGVTAHDGSANDGGGEICNNGFDDDRNGLVDDGCPCLPGQMQQCFPGEPALAGNGVCHMGQQRCTGQGELGSWDACTGAGLPSPETCDGLDNDCDGNVDNGLGSTTCGSGLCQVTVLNCVNGVAQTCTPGAGSPEVCDGMDNDCNGMVDDGLGTTTCGSGSCVRMVMNCVGGMPRTCDSSGPSPEMCDGVDNDCNGLIDDGLPSLTCGTGPCMHTVPSCVSGMPQTCTPLAGSPEVCDGIDNDCNGAVDDGLGTTMCGTGTCVRMVMNCVGGVPQTCSAMPASPEVCNGIDDDCNGAVDDGLGSTTCGTGLCARTVPNCVSGVPQTCSAPTSSPEVCDGIDNDCNGAIDDGIPGTACSVAGQPCRTGTTACVSGTTVCNATGFVPSGTPCPPTGVCDNVGVCHPPVNCMGSWGACTVPCGGGTMTYTVSQPAQYGGADCPYANGATQSCNESACPPTCGVVNYPYITWTCPADGDHSEYIAVLGCYCESYDASGNGVNCSLSDAYSVPNCVPGPTENLVEHPGTCYCHL